MSTTPQDPVAISQVAITGSTPDLQTGIIGNPGETVTSSASVLDEYVSAGGFAWYANLPRSLTWAIDDVTRDLGDDLYNRMMADAKVKSLVDNFKAAVLEDGVTLLSAVTDKGHPNHAAAAELVDWCQDALDRMEVPLEAVLWNLLDCVAYGNKVAEIVWHHTQDKDGKPVLFPRALKVKPRHALAYVVDAFYNVLGFLVLTPGMITVVQPDQLFASLSDIPNFIPREKFLMLTFRMTDNDPRGVSILRAAYNAWNLKMQAWPEWLKYLVQFASPSLIGFTPEGAEPINYDQYGNPITSVSPEQAMANQLANFRNGAVLAFPNGSSVQPVHMAGAGEPFANFIDTANREMAVAVLGAALSTEEGKHQTRASTGNHTDLKDMLVRLFKPVVAKRLRNDLLVNLVRYNRPQDLRFLPSVSLTGVEEQDFAGLAAGVAALTTAGFIGDSQRVGIDRMLGLPPRNTVADAADEAEAIAIGNPLPPLGDLPPGAKMQPPTPEESVPATQKGAA